MDRNGLAAPIPSYCGSSAPRTDLHFGPLLLRDGRRHRLAAQLVDGAETGRTRLVAAAALDALLLVDHVDDVPDARDRLHRASLAADHAGLALLGIDVIRSRVREQTLDLFTRIEVLVVLFLRQAHLQLVPHAHFDVGDEADHLIDPGLQLLLIEALGHAERPQLLQLRAEVVHDVGELYAFGGGYPFDPQPLR